MLLIVPVQFLCSKCSKLAPLRGVSELASWRQHWPSQISSSAGRQSRWTTDTKPSRIHAGTRLFASRIARAFKSANCAEVPWLLLATYLNTVAVPAAPYSSDAATPAPPAAIPALKAFAGTRRMSSETRTTSCCSPNMIFFRSSLISTR
jgi:hypothetical protein